MIVKLSSELVSALGVANASEAQERIAALASTEKPATVMSDSKLTLESLTSQISALDARVAALEKLFPGAKLPDLLTEARVKELITAELATEEHKKVIGAEASRVFLEAGAATGTHPAKASPAPALAEADAAKGLIDAGKFAEAYAASPELRAEFPDANCFAAYAKANAEGRITFAKSPHTQN